MTPTTINSNTPILRPTSTDGIFVTEVLVALGVVGSREKARRVAYAGEVKLNGQRIDSAGLLVRVGRHLIQVGERAVHFIVDGKYTDPTYDIAPAP